MSPAARCEATHAWDTRQKNTYRKLSQQPLSKVVAVTARNS